ncbi:MAG: spore coat protein U-like protein [Granulosicoccus sp.]|jgi:spore coat protein U-like protein
MKKITLLPLCLILSSTLTEAAVTCHISSQVLSFGTIEPLSSAELTSIGEINVSCTGGPVSYSIHLSAGNGSIAERVMRNGSKSLNYNLYTSNSYFNVLGDGTEGSFVINGSSTNMTSDSSYSVFGKISNIGLSSIEPGIYTDSVLVTIFY